MAYEAKADDYWQKQGRHLSDAALNLREAGFAYPVSLPLPAPAAARRVLLLSGNQPFL